MFINDGSRDRSAALLAEQFRARPDTTRVILLNGNYGQHMAILAGFEQSRGEIVVTLDADLQNPPEEIGKLVAKMREGYDYVGTIRRSARTACGARKASRAMNRLRERITRIKMTDQGCMLRAYSRHIIDTINRCGEINTFIPALAYTFAQNPIEIEVAHEERFAGESKYSLYSADPPEFRSGHRLLGGAAAMAVVHRRDPVARVGGAVRAAADSPLHASARKCKVCSRCSPSSFFLLGVIIFALGLLGEYIGRIYQQVRARPRYLVQTILEQRDGTTVAEAPRQAVVQAVQAAPLRRSGTDP